MDALALGLRSLVPRVHVFSGYFRRNAAPILWNERAHERDREWDRHYLLGAYLLDPLYEQFLRRDTSVTLSPKDMYPADFTNRDFYRAHYLPYGWRDKVSYLVYARPDVAVFVTLARHIDEPPFSAGEVKTLHAVLPAVEQVAVRVWSQRSGSLTSLDKESIRLHRAFNNAYSSFGREAKLSAREREVTRLLLRGLPPKSVCAALRIAPGTVRNHIKHIYIKLDVRSQAALLALFFQTLEQAALSG